MCDNPTLLSPLALAFLGDAVFDLLAREQLLLEANRPAGKLHQAATEIVNAQSQAERARNLLPLLSEEEAAVFRRGRNASPKHVPGTCTREAYALATGLEALFGWLWLMGRPARAKALYLMNSEAEDIP